MTCPPPEVDARTDHDAKTPLFTPLGHEYLETVLHPFWLCSQDLYRSVIDHIRNFFFSLLENVVFGFFRSLTQENQCLYLYK